MPRIPRSVASNLFGRASASKQSSAAALRQARAAAPSSGSSYLTSLAQQRCTPASATRPGLLGYRPLSPSSPFSRPLFFAFQNTPTGTPTSPVAHPHTASLPQLLCSNLISNMRRNPLGQLRYAARGTEYQPSQRKRKRKFGFLARQRSKAGRRILARRKSKGRRYLSH